MFAPTDWAAAGPAYPGADADAPPPAAGGRRKRPQAAAAAADAVVSLADVLGKDGQPVKHDAPAKKKKEKRRGGDDTAIDPSTPAPAKPARGARENNAHAAAAAHAPPPASPAEPARPPAPVDKPQKKKNKRVRDDGGTAGSPPPPPVVLPAADAGAATARPPPKKPGKRNKFKKTQQQQQAEAAAAVEAPAPASRTPTLDRFRARLAAGAFRALNEALYTRPGAASYAEFSASPALFAQYHAGFRAAVAKWPASPLAAAIAFVQETLPPSSSVVDFGCGEAGLAAAVGRHAAVTSLDLVAAAPGVIACDMAATPLPTASADAAVFCLALMGTDYPAALAEARRVLKPGGWLWIAEVRSRFVAPGSIKDDVRPFVGAVCGLGFEAAGVDAGNPMFVVLKFRKKGQRGGGHAPPFPDLKPCTYKRR